MCGITAAPNKNGAKSEQDRPRAKKGQEVWIPYHRSLLIVLTGVWSQTLQLNDYNTKPSCERVANGRRIVNINSAFPSNYLKASDLNGAAVPVTIREVKMEEVGRTKDHKPVLYFMGKEKGLVLNRTNSKKIAELAGSQDTEDWGGTVIALYPTETEFAGETVECIRVKAPKSAQKPKPAPEPVAELDDNDITF